MDSNRSLSDSPPRTRPVSVTSKSIDRKSYVRKKIISKLCTLQTAFNNLPDRPACRLVFATEHGALMKNDMCRELPPVECRAGEAAPAPPHQKRGIFSITQFWVCNQNYLPIKKTVLGVVAYRVAVKILMGLSIMLNPINLFNVRPSASGRMPPLTNFLLK